MKRSYPLAWLNVKLIVALGWCILGSMPAKAQFTVINSEVVIKPNTLFSVQGLTFNPGAEVIFTDNVLKRSNDPVDYAGIPSVNQVYTFDEPIAYTGTLRFPYTDAMLVGESAGRLKLIYTSEEGGLFTVVPQTMVNESGRFAEHDFQTSTTLKQLSAWVDVMPPVATAIEVSGTPTANAGSIQFTVFFDKVPANVSTGDFTLTATGSASADITSVSPVNANTVTVSIDAITGTGTLRLDVNANSGITDTEGNGAGNHGYVAPFTGGDVHTVDREPPAIPSMP